MWPIHRNHTGHPASTFTSLNCVAHTQPLKMQATMINSMNLSATTAVPRTSVRRCNGVFASRPVQLRCNRMVIRAEADKSIEAKAPNVDRSKTENIEAGNISNENAEKRADIGKTREPTPTGAHAF